MHGTAVLLYQFDFKQYYRSDAKEILDLKIYLASKACENKNHVSILVNNIATSFEDYVKPGQDEAN